MKDSAKHDTSMLLRNSWAAANSVLPQLAVMCKIEANCSYQTFVQVDSEVLPCLPAGRETRSNTNPETANRYHWNDK